MPITNLDKKRKRKEKLIVNKQTLVNDEFGSSRHNYKILFNIMGHGILN